MANAYSFPLLRLPLLAVIKGIQLMNVREQFKLSKLSKRSLFIVKKSVKNHGFHLKIELRKEIPVKIKSRTASNEYIFNFQPGLDYPDLESIQNFIVQVASVFSDLTISLDLDEAPYPRYLMDLIPLTKNLNLKRGLLAVSTDKPDDELCRFIFNECKDFKQLWLYCETSPDFESSPEQIGMIRNDQFVIDNPWFTMNYVLHCCMNCKTLDLSSLNFSVTEVNRFLQNWIQGSEVGFMHCNISGEVNMEALLEGITSVREPEVMASLNGIFWAPYSDCFIIEQSSGVKGVVFITWDNLFVLSTAFELDNGEKYGSLREFDDVEVDDESADGDVFMDEVDA